VISLCSSGPFGATLPAILTHGPICGHVRGMRALNTSAMSQCHLRILDAVNARGLVQRHRALRWVAPVGIAGAAALAASGVFSAHATTRHLPHTDPTSLIAAVQTSHVDGFTGTVVSHLSLGLPQLPGMGTTTDDDSSLPALLTGSHTMQVWYGGVTKQRLALLGATDETDLFRDGRQVWEWNSAQRSATHVVLPERAGAAGTTATTPVPSDAASLTPDELAKRVLAELDPTTQVQVKRHHSVADRSAYDLVLTPRSATRIASVHIAVDGRTKMPLAVQVYGRGATKPAIDVAFTSIAYGAPAQRNFTFVPPPDAHVHTVHTKRRHPTTSGQVGLGHALFKPSDVHVLGSGWSRVLAAKFPAAGVARLQQNPAMQALTAVSGKWGKGRLLDSDLGTVLITTDGRVFAGAVEPNVLYAAAGAK
jgi:outer membrane lipoprotein-sorting protein